VRVDASRPRTRRERKTKSNTKADALRHPVRQDCCNALFANRTHNSHQAHLTIAFPALSTDNPALRFRLDKIHGLDEQSSRACRAR
jgi:hypothetical protein